MLQDTLQSSKPRETSRNLASPQEHDSAANPRRQRRGACLDELETLLLRGCLDQVASTTDGTSSHSKSNCSLACSIMKSQRRCLDEIGRLLLGTSRFEFREANSSECTWYSGSRATEWSHVLLTTFRLDSSSFQIKQSESENEKVNEPRCLARRRRPGRSEVTSQSSDNTVAQIGDERVYEAHMTSRLIPKLA